MMTESIVLRNQSRSVRRLPLQKAERDAAWQKDTAVNKEDLSMWQIIDSLMHCRL